MYCRKHNYSYLQLIKNQKGAHDTKFCSVMRIYFMKNEERINEIINELKEMFVTRLMLPYEPSELNEDALIFEIDVPIEEEIEVIGLDSVDVLEIMAGVNSLYKVKIDPETQKEAYKTIRTLAEAIYEALDQEKGA